MRFPRHIALPIAERFAKQMLPHVDEVVIAGSLRRQCPDVGDIEIMAIPKFRETQGGLFGDSEWESKLDTLFHKDYPGLISGASRYKKFRYTSVEMPQIKEYSKNPDDYLQIDLFITTISDWGRILAIRTGSASYSQKMIAGGWVRKGWIGTENGLRKRKECYKKTEQGKWQLKPEVTEPTLPPEFPTEESFFDFIDLKYVEPVKRNWT